MKSFHYVDDYRYACTYINYRQDRMSRYQLKVKLYGKGVPGELVDRALEECYEGDEQEQIIRLLEKKKFDAQNSDPKEFTRVYQYLMRRGFRSNDVLRKHLFLFPCIYLVDNQYNRGINLFKLLYDMLLSTPIKLSRFHKPHTTSTSFNVFLQPH